MGEWNVYSICNCIWHWLNSGTLYDMGNRHEIHGIMDGAFINRWNHPFRDFAHAAKKEKIINK